MKLSHSPLCPLCGNSSSAVLPHLNTFAIVLYTNSWQRGDISQTGQGVGWRTESWGPSPHGGPPEVVALRRWTNPSQVCKYPKSSACSSSASCSRVHRFTMTSTVLEVLLWNKVAKCSSWGLGQAPWPECLLDNSLSKCFWVMVFHTSLFKIYQQVQSLRQGGKCFLWVFLPFNQPPSVLLVSKQHVSPAPHLFSATWLWDDILYLQK